MPSAQVFTPTVTIKLKRHLPVTPARLWHALSDSAEVSAWMKFPATIGPGLGGRVMVDFGHNAALDGVICLYEPGECFGYTWGDSIVRFAISDDGAGEPDLTVSHFGVSPELAAGLAAGWHAFLDQLQQGLTGIARTSKDADLLAHYKQVFAGFEQA